MNVEVSKDCGNINILFSTVTYYLYGRPCSRLPSILHTSPLHNTIHFFGKSRLWFKFFTVLIIEVYKYINVYL